MDSDNEERLQSSEVEGKNALKGRIWEESKKTLRIAFPTMLFRVASFGMAVVTQLFVGHFGQIELAAYALIQTILVLFVSGVLVSSSFVLIPFTYTIICKLVVHSSKFILSNAIQSITLKLESCWIQSLMLQLKISTFLEFVYHYILNLIVN